MLHIREGVGGSYSQRLSFSNDRSKDSPAPFQAGNDGELYHLDSSCVDEGPTRLVWRGDVGLQTTYRWEGDNEE